MIKIFKRHLIAIQSSKYKLSNVLIFKSLHFLISKIFYYLPWIKLRVTGTVTLQSYEKQKIVKKSDLIDSSQYFFDASYANRS